MMLWARLPFHLLAIPAQALDQVYDHQESNGETHLAVPAAQARVSVFQPLDGGHHAHQHANEITHIKRFQPQRAVFTPAPPPPSYIAPV